MKGYAVLLYLPEFLAKAESAASQVEREFNIKSLNSLTDDYSELLLCPVRAVKKYLSMTKSKNRSNKLFVSPTDFSKPLSKNAISSFLREVIRNAFQNIPDESRKLTRVHAHEIHAVATSFRFKYNLGQVAMIKRAYWRSNTVFCSRYLRDISHSFLDVSGLGPLFVAKGVVRPID